MSAAEELQGDEGDLFDGFAPGGGVFLYALEDFGDSIAVYPELSEALEVNNDTLATIHELFPGTALEGEVGPLEFQAQAWQDGSLPYQETGNFWRWVRYNLGVNIIPVGAVASGLLAGYLLKWDKEHGIAPAKEPTYDLDKPLSKPTQGQRIVVEAGQGLTQQSVTAPGFTKAQAQAISTAIGVATADVLKAQALVTDRMLPGMAPGQVPESLKQLDTAAGVLERQVAALRKEVGTGKITGVAGTVSGISKAVVILQGEVKTLSEQMTGDKTSGLLADVDGLRQAVAGDKLELAHINKTLPDLATTAALTALTGKVAVTVEELDLKHASALDTALNGVEHNVTALKAKTDELDECCDLNSQITNPIRQGGATPSLLKSLGSLLKGAVEGVFLATILDSVLLIFDAPAVISTTVIDTETLSNWAVSAAGVIEQDLSWLGKFPSGG